VHVGHFGGEAYAASFHVGLAEALFQIPFYPKKNYSLSLCVMDIFGGSMCV
jgi:hypothetical protein